MRSHAFDPLSFLGGLVFTGLGVAGAAGALADVDNLRVGWPLVLVALGVLLVASAVRPAARGAATDPAVDPAASDAAMTGLGADPATIGADMAETEPSQAPVREDG